MKIIKNITLLAIGAVALTLFVGNRNHNVETRHATGTVVEEGTNTIIRTDDGHEWLVNSGIRQGSRVSLDFDTRNTEMLEDDIVVSIKPITINNGLKKSVIIYYKYTK